MNNPKKGPGTSDRPLEALARARHADMQRAAAEGERYVRLGAAGRKRRWAELCVAWLIIVAFAAAVVWFVAFGYESLAGDDDGEQSTVAVPNVALFEVARL